MRALLAVALIFTACQRPHVAEKPKRHCYRLVAGSIDNWIEINCETGAPIAEGR